MVAGDKLLFFHIPKTGGTFIKEFLLNYVEDNSCVVKIPLTNPFGLVNEHIPPTVFDEEFVASKKSFCFIRNPITWYKSQWAFRFVNGWDKDFPLYKCRSNDFNKYVSNIIDSYPNGFVSSMYEQVVPYVNYVGNQEFLNEDLKNILEKCGVDFKVEAIHSDYRANRAYSLPEIKDKVKYKKSVLDKVKNIERYCKYYD